MSTNKNQVRNLATSSKKNLSLASLALVCLLLSLTVFYPLSMKVDQYSNALLTLLAYSFYLLQFISFALMMVTFVNGLALIKAKRDTRNSLALLIDVILIILFAYEMYWFFRHL